MTGLTPLDYVNKIRIDRAKHLLVTTNDRLYEIGQHVGFNNEYYFSRRFRQEVGVSPDITGAVIASSPASLRRSSKISWWRWA